MTDKNNSPLVSESDFLPTEEDQLRSLYRQRGVDPDKFAKARQLSRATGLPMQTVQNREAEATSLAQEPDWGSLSKGAPNTAAKLVKSPELFTLSKDDTDNLSWWERTFNETKRLAKGAGYAVGVEGISNYGAQLIDFNAFLWDMLPGDYAAKQAAISRGMAQRTRQANNDLRPQAQSLTEQAAMSGLSSSVQTLAVAPLGLSRAVAQTATQAANVTSGVLGTLVGAEAYTQAREQGKNKAEAGLYAVPQGMSEFLFERLPAIELFKDVERNTGLFKTLVKQYAAEIPSEQLTTLFQDFNTWVNLNPDKTVQQFLEERPGAAYQTLVATMVGTTVQTGAMKGVQKFAERSAQDTRKQQEATQDAERLQQMLQVAAQSKLRTRAPDTFAQFVQATAEEVEGGIKEVYVDPQTLRDVLGQSGVDVGQFIGQVPSVATQLQENSETNTPIAIPIGELTAYLPGTGLEAVLLPHLRTAPDALSQAEAQAASEQAQTYMQSQAQAVIDQAADAQAVMDSADKVKGSILSQLSATNRFTSDVNEAYANLVRDFYTATSGRFNITPEEMYQRYPLQIGAGGTATDVLNRATTSTAPTAQPGIGEVLADRINNDFDGAVQEYSAVPDTNNGQVLNTDLARELSPEYRADRSRAAEVHEASSGFINKLYETKLSQPTPEGKLPYVLFTAGGTGAGKSTALDLVGGALTSQAEIVFDGTMSKFASADKKIQQALKAGREVRYLYVYREPREALKNGALPRAMRSGRTAPLSVLQESHVGARQVISQLVEKYKGDPRVEFIAVDNSRGLGNAELVALAKIPEVSDNGLKEALNEILETEYQAGRISEAVYRGTKNSFGSGTGQGTGGSAQPAVGSGFQSEAQKLDAEQAEAANQAVLQEAIDVSLSELATPEQATLADFQPEALPNLLNKQGWSVLTAEDPGAAKATPEQNAVAMANLEADLRDMGLEYLPIVGKYGDVQNGFIVVGLAEHEALALGRKYGQDSVLTRSGLIYGDGSIDPATGSVEVYDTPPGDFYTEIPGTGAFFSVEIDFDARRAGVFEQGVPRMAWGKPKATQQGATNDGQTGDRTGRYSSGDLAPLEGAPTITGATGPDPRLVAVAEQYALDNGITLRRQAKYVKVDPERAKRIAAAYDAMEHAPQDPAVQEAYANLIQQTMAQYRALEAAGYQFYLVDESNDPYAGNPWNAMRDLRANQAMGVFATEAGFGSGATELNVEDNPLLADTGLRWPYGSLDGEPKRVLANDLFRAVHDAFGHGLEGAGFRAEGEENAWQAHVRLFTGSAVAAITSETRGQNSWLNYGPYGEQNRTAKVEETVFADQKTGLLPEWTWTEGVVADEPAPEVDALAQTAVEPKRPGSVDITGVHFSREARTSLNGAYYGTGLKGLEAQRLATTSDSRLKERVYFYVDEGKGVRPEAGVGGVAHQAQITNLYDAKADPLRLWRGDINDIEARILDAGFNGYYIRDAFNNQGAAVVLGEASRRVPVEQIPNPTTQYTPPAQERKVRVQVPTASLANLDEAALRAVAPSAVVERSFIAVRPSAITVNAGEFDAARELLAGQGVELPEQVLNQSAIDQTQTPEFKAWFGDSKVVDANGNPLVVYHGAPKNFTTFDRRRLGARDPGFFGRGFYFTPDQNTAQDYADSAAEADRLPVEKSVVIPVYVSLQNPFVWDMSVEGADATRAALAEMGIKRYNVRGDSAALGDDTERKTFNRAVRAAGFDGVVVRDEDGFREIVAFEPTQIKSATGNSGAFDGNDPNILRQSMQEDMAGQAQFLEERAKAAGFDNVDDWAANDVGGFTKATEEWRQMNPVAELAQPARGTFNPSQLRIDLLKDADLSTFLHETGHFFFDVLSDLATQPNAPADIVTDWQTVAKWAGFTQTQWAQWQAEYAQTGAINKDMRRVHEKFAESFEQYLFEGKAPSAELKPLFRRFREFMVNVYKTLEKFMARYNTQLTDEVRGVFDRLIATEAQIKEAERQAGMLPDFDATNEAIEKMSARSLRDLKWTINARGKMLKRLQADVEAKRKAVREEVATEVRDMPEYAVQRFLKYGELRTDGEVSKVEGGKLSLPVLKEMYGEAPAAMWRYLATNMVTADATTGLHPNMVAELFGFRNGDEMVRAIIDAMPEQATIDGLTDQRLLERYGDLVTEQGIEQAANEAIHNEARARFVATEIKAMREAMNQRESTPAGGSVNTIVRAAKEFAQNLVARRKVRDLKPSLHTAAEARAARRAEDARIAGDTQAAVSAKRDQLLNHYAAKLTMDARDEIDTKLDYLRKFDKDSVRKNMPVEYMDQIDKLLERVELRRGTTLTQLDKRAKLAAWIEAQQELGLNPAIPDYLLEDAQLVSYKEMTVEEFRGLVDAVRNIEHLGRLKDKLLTLQDKRAFAAVVQELETSIRDNATKSRPDRVDAPGPIDNAKDAVRGFLSMHRKLASLVRQMDGSKDGGALWGVLIRSMNAAADSEASARNKATKQLSAIFEPLLKSSKLREKAFIPAINKSLSLETRLVIALNWGNEANQQRVMDGDRWSDVQVQAILSTLTPDQLQFVQKVWDYIDSFWPDIRAKEERVAGIAPEKVQALPFTVQTADGTEVQMKGGYYPIKYDPDRSSKADADSAAEVTKQMLLGNYTRATTRRGHTKARADEVNRAVRKDIGVVFEHVNQVVHDLAWHEWLIDATRVLRAAPVDSAIRETMGPEVLREMRDAIKDIAAGEVPAQNQFERGLNHIRNGVTIVGMGWNLSTAFLQPLGLTQSMVRVGPKWVGKGLATWLGDAAKMENTAKRVYAQSEFMRLRGETMNREINEIRNKIHGDMAGPVKETYFYMIQKMQLVADMPTWLGAYEKAMAEKVDEKRAVALADQAVRDAQGGGQISDLARIQRGGPLQKLFTNFYSYFSTTFNLTAERFNATSFKDPLEAGRFMVDMVLLYSVPAVLGALMKEAVKGGDDDEELATKLMREQLNFLLGTMVGVRELGASINGFYGYEGPAGTRFFSEVAKLSKQVEQGEVDMPLLKRLNNTAGILLHYPAGQVNRTVEGYIAYTEGRTDNPFAMVFGPPAN